MLQSDQPVRSARKLGRGFDGVADAASPPHSNRLRSLDVMRGFIVAGMIVVNFCMVGAGYRQFAIYPQLAHADWVGFTFADFVFPAFIFIVGVSIALASRGSSRLDGRTARAIVARSLRLFVLGFLLTNLMYQWMHGWSFDGGFRLMGVLQRISLCYAAAAFFQYWQSERTLLGLALLVLIMYWPLALVTVPGGIAPNLQSEGLNFISWVDREVLGPHRWVEGSTGYDTEGLLSTLPAIAQCLLGVIAGRWFVKNATKSAELVRFALAGALTVGVGCAWGVWFPIVKSIWSSSFVALSTGLAMLLLALIQGLMNRTRFSVALANVLEALGVNAILAYVLHFLCFFALALPFIPNLYRALSTVSSPAFANLVIACTFTIAIWWPLAVLYSRGWRVRI